MPAKRKKTESIPKTFNSEQQAGEFWDTHDTTDYPTAFTDANVTVQLKGRRFEIEIDPDVMALLRKRAKRARTNTAHLANRLLRKELTST